MLQVPHTCMSAHTLLQTETTATSQNYNCFLKQHVSCPHSHNVLALCCISTLDCIIPETKETRRKRRGKTLHTESYTQILVTFFIARLLCRNSQLKVKLKLAILHEAWEYLWPHKNFAPTFLKGCIKYFRPWTWSLSLLTSIPIGVFSPVIIPYSNFPLMVMKTTPGLVLNLLEH